MMFARKTSTMNTLSKCSIALILQDAYWYADQAADTKSDGRGMAPTRSEALRRSFQKAREAGLKLPTTLFPRVIASAMALQAAIERYGDDCGVDARTGEVPATAALGAKVEDISWGRVGVIIDVNDTFVTLDTGGKTYQARARNLRAVREVK